MFSFSSLGWRRDVHGSTSPLLLELYYVVSVGPCVGASGCVKGGRVGAGGVAWLQ